MTVERFFSEKVDFDFVCLGLFFLFVKCSRNTSRLEDVKLSFTPILY
jgi:hypothetical protein